MGMFKKGDNVKHITRSPNATMVVEKYVGERVLCKWTEPDHEAEGLFLEEKMIKINTN